MLLSNYNLKSFIFYSAMSCFYSTHESTKKKKHFVYHHNIILVCNMTKKVIYLSKNI